MEMNPPSCDQWSNRKPDQPNLGTIRLSPQYLQRQQWQLQRVTVTAKMRPCHGRGKCLPQLLHYSPCGWVGKASVTAPFRFRHRKDQPLLATKSADLAWEQIRAPRTRCNWSPRSLSLPHPSALPACCPAHAAPALRPYESVPATGCFFGSCESDRLP